MPDRQAFVRALLPLAQAYATRTRIPASVLLAIAAHESNFGAAGNNMLFGIKGPGATMATYEVEGGKDVPQDASFRTYASPDASFRDFVDLVSQGRYAPAWNNLQQTGDWRQFLQGINQAGYATDPAWADKIARFEGSTIAPLVQQGGAADTLGQFVSAYNPLAARTAEAAELDQTSGQSDTVNKTVPATPPRLANGQYTPRQPGYTDSVQEVPIPDPVSGRVVPKTVWTRTWDDGRIEEWESANTATQQKWLPLPPKQDKTRLAAWNQLVDNDRADLKTQAQGQHVTLEKREETIDGKRVVRTYAVQFDLDGNLSVKSVPDLDQPVPAQKSEYITGPRGEIFQINPQTGALALVTQPLPQVVTINGQSGTVDQAGAFKPLTNAPGQPPTIHVAGNRVVTVNPQTGAVTGNTVIDPVAQQQEEQIRGLQIQKAQQDLMPAQALVIKNHYALIDDLQRRVQSGQMTPDQADQYFQANQQYTLAALQGSTPLQIEKQRQDAEDARRAAGINLINQRVSTGGQLASNLLSTASGLAQRAVFRPGQTSFGIDPLALARAFAVNTTNDLGGGQGVSDFAKNLVMGAAPSPAGLAPTDAAGAFTPPWRQSPGGPPMAGPPPGSPPIGGAPQAPLAPMAPQPGQMPPYFPPIPYGAPQA